jgi:hypothetical protein
MLKWSSTCSSELYLGLKRIDLTFVAKILNSYLNSVSYPLSVFEQKTPGTKALQSNTHPRLVRVIEVCRLSGLADASIRKCSSTFRGPGMGPALSLVRQLSS